MVGLCAVAALGLFSGCRGQVPDESSAEAASLERALALLEQGEVDLATVALAKLVGRDPANTAARLRLAEILARKELNHAAEAEYSVVLGYGENVEARIGLARVALARERFEEAVFQYEQAVLADPQSWIDQRIARGDGLFRFIDNGNKLFVNGS